METGWRRIHWLGLVGILLSLGTNNGMQAQQVQHLTTIRPGGFPGQPVMTGIEPVSSNSFRVTWDGPSGYYRLHRALELGQTIEWQPLGTVNLQRFMMVTSEQARAFFQVTGPETRYAGSAVCMGCHPNIHATEANTRHTFALETLKEIGQDTNPNCVVCHTVGFGLPTGFTSEEATPHLAGVQCESCHGPAANHAANESDPTVRPRAELAGQVCGGCHQGPHQPTYEEWSSSAHFDVTFDMSSTGRLLSCGRCHSGSSRLAFIHGRDPAVEVPNDGNVAITCAVCHDPHGQNVWTNVISGAVTTNQLRDALASTNDFFLTTSDDFSEKYDPNIQVCAQCHNHRGASWTSTSRPPHHSPQYNMMLGSVGELAPGEAPYPAVHGRAIEKQCVSCHMPREEFVSEEQPAHTGHTFEVESYSLCLSCHSFPEGLVRFTQTAISNRIQQVKSELDLWATTKAPETLRTKYGNLAWEYSNPGDLSEDADGPSGTEQGMIPDNIKKARFNLYVVTYDGSYGVHNAVHSVTLLDTARAWIREELEK